MDELQKQSLLKVFQDEFSIAKSNKDIENDEFQELIDLIDSVRGPKEYEWMSDIRIPEFIAHMLTQTSLDVAQYFSTRDFVDAFLEDESDEALKAADANKELINRTLNQRHLHHYLKFVRGKTLTNIVGRVTLVTWWEHSRAYVNHGPQRKTDIEGGRIVEKEEDVIEEIPVVDRFNYDVMDERNVFYSPEYTYTAQEKRWIMTRTEKMLFELLNDKSENYINLDKLKDWGKQKNTDASQATKDETKDYQNTEPVDINVDVVKRYGKFWCIPEERDEFGNPITARVGIDQYGKALDSAELHEMVITFAMSGGNMEVIGFEPQSYIDSSGKPYRNIIRGLLYIHPSNDGGVGDGKHIKELQKAIDDTFNISNDRVTLATIPTLITSRYTSEFNPDIRIQPGHNIEVEDASKDLRELQISDDISGAMSQLAFLTNKSNQTDSIYPTTMGDVPGFASTTATAVAGASSNTNNRTNYKALTYENTALQELYWQMTQMTWQYAHPKTAEKLMGAKAVDFDPSRDYYYKPVSASIESEQSKANKITQLNQLLGYVVNMQHPDAPKIFNYLIVKIATLMGDEYKNVMGAQLDTSKPMQPSDQQAGVPGSPSASNQNGIPISIDEAAARGGNV